MLAEVYAVNDKGVSCCVNAPSKPLKQQTRVLHSVRAASSVQAQGLPQRLDRPDTQQKCTLALLVVSASYFRLAMVNGELLVPKR